MLDALTNNLAGTKRPAFRLTLSGNDITANIAPRLMSLTVTDNRGFEADTLTLTLDDADGQIQLPVRGHTLRLAIGWQGQVLTEMGSFIVDQVTHKGPPDQVSITARGVDFRGNMNSTHERSWHDTTLGDIVKDIAGQNDLGVFVPAELSSIKIAHIDQSKESDISFLTRLAMRNGAEVAVKSGTIILVIPGQCMRGMKNVLPVTITRNQGDSHTFSIADRDAYGTVIATWQDTSMPKEQVKQVKLTRKADFRGGGTDYTVATKENELTLPKQYGSQEEAMREAESAWSEQQRNVASFSITLAQGRTDISPETPVSVFGFKTIIDATRWVISKVTHAINEKGFLTRLDLELTVGEVEYEVIKKGKSNL